MHAPAGPLPVLPSIAPLTAGCEAWLADIWGLLHDGVAPFPQAVVACERFRTAGGIVLLLSNAPRPWQSTAAQLARIGVPASAFGAGLDSCSLFAGSWARAGCRGVCPTDSASAAQRIAPAHRVATIMRVRSITMAP